MSSTDDLVANAVGYVESFDADDVPPASPSLHVAVLACMDARIDVHALLGLRIGDAHVIRNAGGVVTVDVIRSLTLSQRLLGTTEVMVVQHTSCGLHGLDEDELISHLETETGEVPPFDLGAFEDLDASVRGTVQELRTNHFLPHREAVRGFLYEVETGRLREVTV